MTGKFILQEYGTGFALFLSAFVSWYSLSIFMEKAGLINDDGRLSVAEKIAEEILDEGLVGNNKEEQATTEKEAKKIPPRKPNDNNDFPDFSEE